MRAFYRGSRRSDSTGAARTADRAHLRSAEGTPERPWPAPYRAALSLSFDDGRPSQLRHCVPLLDRLGVRATFFVLPRWVETDRRGWRRAVEHGHEIGNHSMTHPCTANMAFTRGRPVESLTLDDMREELRSANASIHALLGVDPSVFAYPCGQTFVGRGRQTTSYVPLVAELFEVGRTFNDPWPNAPAHCDLAQVACMNTDSLAFDALEPRLARALAEGAWLVVGGHDVGPAADDETTATATLEAVVAWCHDHRVWIETVGQVGGAIAAARCAELPAAARSER